MERSRRRYVWLGLLLALILSVLLGVMVGAVRVPLAQVVASVTGGLLGGEVNPVIFEIRLPRVLGATLVGALLGVAGATYQGLFRNPLADPYLMGAASGAALGTAVALSVAGALSSSYAAWIASEGTGWVPLFAFLGAIFAVSLALFLAGGVARTQDLILAGVVVAAVLTGLTTYLMMKDADRVRAVFAYTLGNLSFIGWPEVHRLGLYFLLTVPPLLLLARVLNALQLGDEVARSLGLPLEALKYALIAASTLATAVAVAVAGIIGFVGLIVPHTLRRLGGGDHRFLLPASAVGGAVLMVLADLLARVAVRPAELPVGVVTTLLGGPFFLYLLRRSRGA